MERIPIALRNYLQPSTSNKFKKVNSANVNFSSNTYAT